MCVYDGRLTLLMESFRRLFFIRPFLNVLIYMFGSLSLGIAIGYPSPTLKVMIEDFEFSDFELGMYSGITSLTAILGSFITTPLLLEFGRKVTIRTIAGINILNGNNNAVKFRNIFLMLPVNQEF